MADQRDLLRGRLASVINSVADVASQLDPPAPRPIAPPPPPAPPGRPWSFAAAMEPIATPLVEQGAPPANALPPLMPPDVAPPMDPPAHHRFPAKLLGSGVVGIGVVVVAVGGLHLFRPPAPAPAPTAGQIALTAVRPVSSSAPAGGPVPPTQVSFPSGTGTVSIEVNSGTTSGQAPVEIVVSGGEPAVTVSDHDYVLDPSGATLIALTAPSGTFAPGDYQVTISSNGAALGSTAFEVR
ncbi:MAG: hypothetical protein WCB51_02245 [Candidatus Dormiibacterota bacterium]